jgi:hypothetical protein
MDAIELIATRFNHPMCAQQLALIMSPSLENQMCHTLMKVMDGAFSCLTSWCNRGCGHRILAVTQLLRINEDLNGCVEGRRCVSLKESSGAVLQPKRQSRKEHKRGVEGFHVRGLVIFDMLMYRNDIAGELCSS